MGGSLEETVKPNPYVYADDDPVNAVDPSGKDPILQGVLCGLLLGGTAVLIIGGIAGIIAGVITPGINALLAELLVTVGASAVIGGEVLGLVALLQGVCSF